MKNVGISRSIQPVEFTFSDEYLSDWEIYGSPQLSEVHELSKSPAKVKMNDLSRSWEDTECHLSTSDGNGDYSGYILNKISSSNESIYKLTCDLDEDDNDVFGIEYYESNMERSSASPSDNKIFEDLLQSVTDTSNSNEFKCVNHYSVPAVVKCKTCDKFLCIACKFQHNTTHTFVIISGAKQSLLQCKDYHRQKLEEKRSHLVEVKQYQDDISQKRHLVKKHLEQQRAALQEKLQNEFEKLTTQVELVWNQEITVTNRKIKTLSHMIDVEQQHIMEIKKLLKVCLENESTLDECKAAVQKEVEENFNVIKGLNQDYGNLVHKADLTFDLDIDLTPTSSLHRQYFILSQDNHSSSCTMGQYSTGRIAANHLKTCLASRGRVKSSFRTRGHHGINYMASGLSLTDDGHLVVTDLGRDVITMYDKDGFHKMSLNVLPQDDPTAAAQMMDGNFLVACKDGLKLLNHHGKLLRRVEVSIESPQGIVRASNGNIVVTDRESAGSLIHILSKDDFQCIHTIIGGLRAPLFTQAWYVTTDLSGNIVISDCADHTVKILSPQGMFMYEFGGRGCEPGLFSNPAGLCVDAYGHILVADLGNNRIQMFSKTGEFLAVIFNSDNGLLAPIDLQTDSNLDLLVLQGNGEVKVIQYIY